MLSPQLFVNLMLPVVDDSCRLWHLLGVFEGALSLNRVLECSLPSVCHSLVCLRLGCDGTLEMLQIVSSSCCRGSYSGNPIHGGDKTRTAVITETTKERRESCGPLLAFMIYRLSMQPLYLTTIAEDIPLRFFRIFITSNNANTFCRPLATTGILIPFSD